jgi:ribosome maturation factor RimP
LDENPLEFPQENAKTTLPKELWLKEPRLIEEDGQALAVANIALPVIAGLGLRLVRVRLTGADGQTLQIMSENDQGMLTIGDCELISQTLSPILDIEEPITGAYHLEVSSPGIDRPLMRMSDFERYLGHDVKIEMLALHEGRRRFRGFPVKIIENSIVLRLEDTEQEFTLPVANMSEAKLVMTEILIREALRRAKAEEEVRVEQEIKERKEVKGPGRFSKRNPVAWLQKQPKPKKI